MFEVFGQYLIFKELLVFDNKAATVVGPLNSMVVSLVLQDLIGLHDKIGNLLFTMYSFLALVEGLTILLFGVLFLAFILFFQFDTVARFVHV